MKYRYDELMQSMVETPIAPPGWKLIQTEHGPGIRLETDEAVRDHEEWLAEVDRLTAGRRSAPPSEST